MKLRPMLLILIQICTTAVCESPLPLHHYWWANYQQFGNQTAAAQQRYNLLLSEKNPSIYTRKGHLYFLHKTNQFHAIIEYAPLITTTFATDPELQLILVHALQKRGLTAQANKQLLDAYKACPLDAQIVLEVAQLYINNKELHNGLSALDTFLNTAPKKQNHFVFHFLKAQIYVQLKQPDQALVSIKECLELHNAFDKGWLVKAMLEEQRGELEAAIQGYNTFLELTGGTNRMIAQHLTQLTSLQKNSSRKLTKNVSLLDKAFTSFEAKQYAQALAQVNLFLQQTPNDTNARLLKIQIMSNTSAFSHAIALLESWIMQEPDNQIWFEALHLLGHNGAAPGSVLATFNSVRQKYPHNIWAAIYCADLHMRMGAKNSAIVLLESIYTRINDPALKTKVLFQLGLLHFEMSNYERMHNYLEQGNKLGTNFLPLQNLLAYYYATKGKNIARAQQIIDAVSAQDPHNPHYLDTQALIAYKKGDFATALSLLETLHAKYPQDATIGLHLAKATQKMGNSHSAKIIAQQASAHAHSTYEKTKIAKFLTAATAVSKE